MKNLKFLIQGGVLLLPALSSFAAIQEPLDFTGDGKPDILWRRKSGTETWLWSMNGVNHVSNISLSSTDSSLWKIVGTGYFNGDASPDILWQRQSDFAVAVWYMNGTTLSGNASISPADSTWRIVGVGDFGSSNGSIINPVKDGKSDIVWQQITTGHKAVWFMDGVTVKQGHVFDTSSANWNIVAVGDIGTVSGGNPSTAVDGKPDLVVRHATTGELRIRFLDSLSSYGEFALRDGSGNIIGTRPGEDHDKQHIVGMGDYTGDGKVDLLVRHITDGRNFVWTLTGSNLEVGEQELEPTYDPDWRIATQDLNDSQWRITTPNITRYWKPVATAVSSSRIDINILDFHVFSPGQTYSVARRNAGAGAYQTIATGQTGSSYSDTTVSSNTRYDYKITASGSNSSTPEIFMEGVGVDVHPIHSRGRVLLVLETGLAAKLGSDLTTLKRDLVADGWTVVVKDDAPRNEEPNWTSANAAAVVNLKSWIKARYDESPTTTKCVLILGHVAVPYSGTSASDGHTNDHSSPWAADAYYGDVSGTAWTDSGNGQFTNNEIPSELELAVGRVDFARLPHFSTADSAVLTDNEANLIRQYILKNHRYRYEESPFPLPDRGIYTSYFLYYNMMLNNTARTMSSLYGSYLDKLTVGEPFRDNASYRTSIPSVPYLWAFTEGGGHFEQIYNLSGNNLMFTSQMLQAGNESPIAFWMLQGSYFADVNTVNNLCRSVLAKPNYGLVVLPTSTINFNVSWNMEKLAVGEHIGSAFVSSVNANSPRFRWLNLIGDPTLRMSTIKPPTLNSASRSGSTVTLTWTLGEANSGYHIYRAATVDGPFVQLTSNGSPILNSTYSVTDNPANRVYMVRAVKTVSTGRGSYQNLSQGSIQTSN